MRKPSTDKFQVAARVFRRRWVKALLTLPIVGFIVALIVAPAGALDLAGRVSSVTVTAAATATETAMTAWKAAVLGVVEGVTEYLPISSTGHLLVASDMLGLGTTEADLKAANTYAIAIQFGAILAVAGLFWKRFRDMLLGLVGRSEEGRHLLIILIVAFAPAAVLGFLFDNMIEDVLFSSWPIIGAWVVGGILILALERSGRIPRRDEAVEAGRDRVLEISVRQAAIIGLVQCLAMWPGTSRSLAAILGALLVGVSMGAAVEFSFLLGFVTLTAASGYSLLTDGGALIDQFGVVNPLIGLLFAFVSAVVAIKWMIGYLQKNSLAVFGWYRIVAAGLTAGLVISGALHA
ncbi:MAG: undecaprenyl-diphosphate phosphatase [Microthrixaceae bacterium]